MPILSKSTRAQAPLSDAIIVAISKLIDDAMDAERREPSHSDIEFEIRKAGLTKGDPRRHGQPVGKAKRIRSVLSWAMENAPEVGERFLAALLSLVRGCGGFRKDSPNYCGAHGINSATDAFRAEGYLLAENGELTPMALDSLEGAELSDALKTYVRRAKRGVPDAALLIGTSKDLLEATAAHVIVERFGTYPSHANFPALLGQAFVALNLATPQTPPQQGAAPEKGLERSLYELGCAVNALRNKHGTGHGRPWLPSVNETQARAATEAVGTIAEFLLSALEGVRDLEAGSRVTGRGNGVR